MKLSRTSAARRAYPLRCPERSVWSSMKSRCTNPRNKDFRHYGGRGITVCARWLDSFENFLSDMGRRPSPKHTLERRENNFGYSLRNCRWALRVEQARNSRHNRRVTFRGETKLLADWDRRIKLPAGTVQRRLSRGWTTARALSPARWNRWGITS